MVENIVYRNALESAVIDIVISDGKLLVTGASGLIGSCLIDLLMLANEHGRQFEVYALGRNAQKLRKRFATFEGTGMLHFIEQDICHPLNTNIQFDYIIHGASNADPQKYGLNPVETMLINLYGTNNILEYCKEHKGAKAIIMSTFEVYGNVGKDVCKESDNGVIDFKLLRNCYPVSKRCAEQLVRCYVDEYKVNAVIGRLCSIYGPTMTKDDSKAHAQFIRNALKHENIVLKSKGEQRRTYCYVLDAVTGLLAVLAKGERGEAYNISNEKSIASIAEVAQIIAKIVGTKVVFSLPNEIESKGFSNPQNCILDNSKLRTLGWRGCYSLDNGLQETIEILNKICKEESVV